MRTDDIPTVAAAVALGCLCAWAVVYARGVQARRAVSALRTLNPLEPADVDPRRPQRIPRVIYRVSLGRALSPNGEQAWDYTARHNPEYRQVLLSDAEAEHFLREHYPPRVWRAYNAVVPPAGKADLLRYCLMDKLGGVYLDDKSGAGPLRRVIRPSDGLLVAPHSDARLAPWMRLHPTTAAGYPFGELQIWWLAAAPGHPLFAHLLEAVVGDVEGRLRASRTKTESVSEQLAHDPTLLDRRKKLPRVRLGKFSALLNLTGPLAYTDAAMKILPTTNDWRLLPAPSAALFVCEVGPSHFWRKVRQRLKHGYSENILQQQET